MLFSFVEKDSTDSAASAGGATLDLSEVRQHTREMNRLCGQPWTLRQIADENREYHFFLHLAFERFFVHVVCAVEHLRTCAFEN